MTCGIYKISLEDGRCYVGSSVKIERRWKRHCSELRHQKHHSRYLQRAWNKYGEDAFTFSVVEECGAESISALRNLLVGREQYWMDRTNSVFCLVRAQMIPHTLYDGQDGTRRAGLTDENRLSLRHSDLVAEWDVERNFLTPDEVSFGSGKKASWICSTCDYRWEASVASRHNGSGCPVCAHKVVTPERSIVVTAPELLEQWHPTKNAPLRPEEVSEGSGRKIWWLCETCGQEWQAVLSSRVRGAGCPACGRVKSDASRRIPNGKRRSLAEVNPLAASEWHPTKNGALLPTEVNAGSSITRAWWLCSACGNEWQTSVSTRGVQGAGCKKCSDKANVEKMTVSKTQSFLLDTHQEIVTEWHPTKNNTPTPELVATYSNKKVWWLCSVCSHEWRTHVASRSRLGRGCPACSGYAVTGRNSLAANAGSRVISSWHPTKNKNKTLSSVAMFTDYRAWWLCPDGHEWQAKPRNWNGCPVCASFAAQRPELVSQWHPNKNDKSPWDIKPGSKYRAWWVCDKCNHEWQAITYSRTRPNASGCPRCALIKVGDGNRLYTVEQVQEVRCLARTGLQPAQIEKRTGVNRATVHMIVIGKHWAWLPETYDGPTQLQFAA